MRTLLLALLLLIAGAQAPTEPVVRIGLNQNASTVTLRSDKAFTVQQTPTRTARFTMILSVDAVPASRALTRADLRYRTLVELDGGRLLVLPTTTKVRIEPAGAVIEIDNRRYRGSITVFGNARNTFTVVNELPMEDYLLGVVPNELSPTTFGALEALKAQAVAARTYVLRNLGHYKDEGYDICATDQCQVYFGAGTEHPLATRAVAETRGMIATYGGQPINALYMSTCGGRTESSENVFGDKLPYLVSTVCQYKHPEPLPFSSSRAIPDWKDAVLAVAGVSNFTGARRFMGLPGQGEPPSMDVTELAPFIRQSFYPAVRTTSDLSFLTEQGILPPSGTLPVRELLFRLIEKKAAFEWQQGVLISWDGARMKLMVNGQPKEFTLSPDAPIYQRVGDEKLALSEGAWIGGELIDFRAVDGAIRMLAYRNNFANPAADRYSRVALWQAHKTRQELDTAFASLKVGGLQDVRVVELGPSERPVNTEIVGSSGRRPIGGLQLRSLLGLRDSLFSFDIERNARGEIIGMMFFGRGWGHGVGMCQVGAYGMALDGATYDQILKTYYNGIDLKKLYRLVVTRDWPSYLPEGVRPYLEPAPLAALFLGMSSGATYAMIGATLTTRLAQFGIRKSAVTMFALVFLAYNFKFLWAPLVDTVRMPVVGRFGQRRSWLCASGLFVMATVVLLGSLDPQQALTTVALAAVLVGVAGATFDIVIDAYRIELLEPRQLGVGSGMYQYGWRMGAAGAGAVALMVAARYGWAAAYTACALFALPAMAIGLVMGEPPRHREPPSARGAIQAVVAYFSPLTEFFKREGALIVLVFVLIHKIGDTLANLTLRLLFQDLGFTNDQIAFYDVGIGFIALLVGVFVGGILYARFGMKRSVLISLVLMAISNLGFAALAAAGPTNIGMAAAIGFENFASGIGGVTIVAYLSALCNLRFTATQYALLSALASIAGRFLTGTTAGALIEAVGYVNFYLLTTLVAMPGVILFWYMIRSGLADVSMGSAGREEKTGVTV